MTGRVHRRYAVLGILVAIDGGLLSLDFAGGSDISAWGLKGAGLVLSAIMAVLGTNVPDMDLRFLRRYPWTGHILPHRGPTHSFAAIAALWLPVSAVSEMVGFPNAGRSFLLGWIVHVLVDAVTPQGVALMWPWRRRIRLIPRRFCVSKRTEELVFWLIAAAFLIPAFCLRLNLLRL